jgi:hypothetical protein
MSERFDDLTRRLAEPVPRRRALRMFGAATAAGVAAAVVRPFRGDAICYPGDKPCGVLCCSPGQVCSSDGVHATHCCCPAGSAPCGAACCASGVACLSRRLSLCGCQPGTTRCGTASKPTCCPAGTTCAGQTCLQPIGNYALAICGGAPSDINLKRDIVPVSW